MIHHSNCGMELFTGDTISQLLGHSLHTASYESGQWQDRGEGPGSRSGEFIDWLTIIYKVETGGQVEVPEATHLGRAG